uniref:Uncharacterized protein n=1 Tax=Anguilla anguilla TaxID=7936 RepID=A0A0E9WY57_ANGAN
MNINQHFWCCSALGKPCRGDCSGGKVPESKRTLQVLAALRIGPTVGYAIQP